jgi:Ca2+-binding RTX toxin-like protein
MRRAVHIAAVLIGSSLIVGCGQEDPQALDIQIALASRTLAATPQDPVAFCRASGLNVIIGDSNDNVINGTAGSDCIVGLGGQDTINGNGGNDIIFGGDGDDVINGGAGDDQIYGGSGQDTIHGNGGNDVIFGEDGDDHLDGGGGNDTLIDCSGHNVFAGGSGTNTCQGSASGSASSTFSGCQQVLSCSLSNDWPQFQQDSAHGGQNLLETSFTPANVASPLAIAWKGHFGDGVADESGAVEAGGFVYVGDAGSEPDFAGKVSVFHADGCGGPAGGSCEPIWQGLTGANITTTPAVGGGFVLVASRAATADNSPFLFAFPAGGCGAPTCGPTWRGVLQNAVVDSSPAIANGIAYLGDFGGRFYAFDMAACAAAHSMNCKPLWTGQVGPEEELTTAPVVGPHFVVIGSFLVDPDFFGGKVNAFRIGGCGQKAGVPCAPAWTADLASPASGQTIAGSTLYVGAGAGAFAFPEAGCGASVCKPLRTYDLMDSGALGAPVVSGDTLLVSSQATPDPTTIGVVSAFSASGAKGCKSGVCEPQWTGVNFGSGFESSPAVAGGVVFVGKAPASGFPVDAGVFTYDLRGCGASNAVCPALALTQAGQNQFNLGAPLSVARSTVYFVSNDNDDNHSNVYAFTLP